jgi:hypothetical protein
MTIPLIDPHIYQTNKFMNYLHKILALTVMVLTIPAVHAAAKDAPTSPKELATRLEQAVKAKTKARLWSCSAGKGCPKT